MLYVEISLNFTKESYCFVKHKQSDFSFHFMWHSQGKRTSKASIANFLRCTSPWFQTFTIQSIKINIKPLKKFEENFKL